MASDIVYCDEHIPLIWRTVNALLSKRDKGSMFVLSCSERPTIKFNRGRVTQEATDTVLKDFVAEAESFEFEAGEVPLEHSDAIHEGERQRMFVFVRTK